MRAGIDDGVAVEVVRQVGIGVVIGAILAKGKLQDAHAGQSEFMAQGVPVGRDDAEVFGNDGQRAQGGFDRLEQRRARAGQPAPADGCRVR